MALSPDSHNVPAAGCGSNSRTSAYEDDELLWPRLPQPLPWDCIDVEVERFRQWLRLLLFRLLSLLCSVEGEAGMAWASALACLVSLVTFEGRVVRAYAEELTLDVVAEMISQAQASLWPMPLRCWLEVLAANLLYTRDMHFEGNGPENGHTTGILAGSIDSERLAAFGGPGAVLRCFMQATTQRSRHAFFCVLFDIAASGIAGAPSTAQVPEVQLIGAALLRLRAPEAVHAILTAEATTLGGAQGSSAEMLQGLAEAARELLAEWQAANPAEVPRVSPNLLADCFASLGRVLSAECRIPSDLESAFHSTIEGLGSSGAGITAGAALGDDWDALADALRDTSALGMSVASAWLRQILISAAEQDIERSLAEGRHPGALLPAPDIRPASWKVHDVHAMSSVPEIKALLAAVLPEPTGTAANTFIGAVKALLDHVRMRAAGLALRQNYVGAGKTGASWHAVHAPTVALATLLLAVDWLNLTPAAARRPAMVQAAECLVSWLVVRKLDDQSAEDAAASQGIAPVKPDAASVPGYGALAPSDAEAAHVAMHATQPQTGPGTPASIQQAHRTAPSTPLPSVSPLESKSSRPQSGLQGAPLAKIVPVPKLAAAWRRLTAPHASRPRQSSLDEDEGPSRPLSAGVAALGGAPYSHVEPSAGQPAGGQRTEQGSNVRFQEPLPEPQPPSAVEERHQHRHSMLGGGASLLDIAAERAAEEQQSAAAEQGAWARALAEAEASVGAVQSFLEGLSGCQGELLQHVDPAYFRAVFDALRPPAAEVSLSAGTPGGRPSTPGPPHSGLRGHPAGSSAVNGPLSRLSALQEGRPLWDARAAVLALLLARCTLESQGDGGHPAGLFGDDSVADGTLAAKAVDSAFLASLLSDPDSRVRRHASVYVLGRSAMKDPARHRAAMRAVVAKAQRGDDERLLTSPEAQVSTLLEMRVLVPGDLA